MFKESFQETKVFIFCKLYSAKNSFVAINVCKLSNLNCLNGTHAILKRFRKLFYFRRGKIPLKTKKVSAEY
jgi:hypothetical protein